MGSRQSAGYEVPPPVEDQDWSFGQFLAMFLLAASLLSASDLFSESKSIGNSPEHEAGGHDMEEVPQNVGVLESSEHAPIPRERFHQNIFKDFLWFKLYIGVAIPVVIDKVITISTVDFLQKSTSSALGYIAWIPNALVYSVAYMGPCCILQKYCGHNGTRAEYKTRPLICVLTWLWAIALLTAAVFVIFGGGVG